MSGNDSNPYTSPQPNYTYSFYGITGQRLATLNCNGSNYPAYPVCSITGQNVYFGGKLIVSGGVNVVTDRLGTVRANGQGESFAYYPYGEERTSTVDKRDKFGTYFRDSVGQDYADQRYYNAGMGRFWSVDSGAVDATNPATWNRYGYAGGDPVNYYDPSGMNLVAAIDPDTGQIILPGGGSGGVASYIAGITTFVGEGFQTGAGGVLVSGGTGTRRGGGGAGPCNNQVAVGFVNSHMADALQLANALQVPVQFVLAVSADESTYGTSLAAAGSTAKGVTPAYNFFGIWYGDVAKANDSIGPWKFQPTLAAYTSADGYADSGLAFVAFAKSDGAAGVTDALQFFTDIQAQFGVTTPDYAKKMVGVVNSIIAFMNCPH